MGTIYRTFVTDTAFTDIQKALSFLSRVSPDAAKRLNHEIQETIRSLCQFPFRFETVDMPKGLGYDFRRAIIKHRYLLIYTVKDETVYVERLVDARQGLAALLS